MNKVRLGDVVQFQRGVSWSAHQEHRESGPGRIPVLRIPNVQERLITRDLVYLSGVSNSVRSRAAASKGWILAVGSNGNPERIGNAVLINEDTDFLFASFLVGIKPDHSQVLDRYMLRILRSEQVRSHLRVTVRGSTGLQNINLPALANLRIDLPSVPVQGRIVEILDSLDDEIEGTERVIHKYLLTKQALVGDLLPINGQAQLRPLRDIAVISGGVTLGSEPSGPGTIRRPYLRVANVQDGHLNLREIKFIRIRTSDFGRFALSNGDVLMNEGGDADKLGRGTVWEDQIEGCLHQNHVFRVRADLRVLEPWYLAHLSASTYGKKYFLGASKQTTNLATINSTQIGDFPIPLPPLSEQRRIVEIISIHDGLLAKEKIALGKLKSLKAGLMTDLLSGRVPVRMDGSPA